MLGSNLSAACSSEAARWGLVRAPRAFCVDPSVRPQAISSSRAALDCKAINPRGFGGQRPLLFKQKMRSTAWYLYDPPNSIAAPAAFGSALLCILEAIALAVALKDVATMRQAIQRCAG